MQFYLTFLIIALTCKDSFQMDEKTCYEDLSRFEIFRKFRWVNGKCYAFETRRLTVRHAQKNCESIFGNKEKGTLFEPDDQETFDAVHKEAMVGQMKTYFDEGLHQDIFEDNEPKDLLKRQSMKVIHTGFIKKDGEIVKSSNGEKTTFAPWEKEPDKTWAAEKMGPEPGMHSCDYKNPEKPCIHSLYGKNYPYARSVQETWGTYEGDKYLFQDEKQIYVRFTLLDTNHYKTQWYDGKSNKYFRYASICQSCDECESEKSLIFPEGKYNPLKWQQFKINKAGSPRIWRVTGWTTVNKDYHPDVGKNTLFWG